MCPIYECSRCGKVQDTSGHCLHCGVKRNVLVFPDATEIAQRTAAIRRDWTDAEEHSRTASGYRPQSWELLEVKRQGGRVNRRPPRQ